MSDAVRAVILSEDRQLECFIRRFLYARNWNRHQIRVETMPKAIGSGEQWVRKQFITELKAYRQRSSRAATCLIVATDADKLIVSERIRWFNTVCDDAGVAFRQTDERVAFIIPKRNIETWLAYLRGESVDEQTEYRKYQNESECKDDVAQLNRMCQQLRLDPSAPHSLALACGEFKRICHCQTASLI